MTRRAPWPALALLPALGLVPADAAPDRGEKLVLQPGLHRAQDLIDRAARFLGRNYLTRWIDVPECRVTLQSRLELDDTACEDVISQILYTHDLVMTPVDERRGVYEWIHLRGERRDEIVERAIPMAPDEVLSRRTWKVYVRTVARMNAIDADEAARALAPFFPSRPYELPRLVIGTAGRGVVLSGFADSVAAALRLLAQMDEAPAADSAEDVRRRIDELEQRLRKLEQRGK